MRHYISMGGLPYAEDEFPDARPTRSFSAYMRHTFGVIEGSQVEVGVEDGCVITEFLFVDPDRLLEPDEEYRPVKRARIKHLPNGPHELRLAKTSEELALDAVIRFCEIHGRDYTLKAAARIGLLLPECLRFTK